MKKVNGFAFIETVISVVILSASLLYIYNSYNAIIRDEETRLYYDDISYVYKTNYLRRFLEEYSNIELFKKNENLFDNSYIVRLGSNAEGLFNDNKAVSQMEFLAINYNINQMLLIKSEMFDACFSSDNEKCGNSLEPFSYSLRSYINTLSDKSYDYYLVVEYSEIPGKDSYGNTIINKCTPGSDINCVSNYASLGI